MESLHIKKVNQHQSTEILMKFSAMVPDITVGHKSTTRDVMGCVTREYRCVFGKSAENFGISLTLSADLSLLWGHVVVDGIDYIRSRSGIESVDNFLRTLDKLHESNS